MDSFVQEARRMYDNATNQFSIMMISRFGQYYPLVTFSSTLSLLVIIASFPPIPLFVDFTTTDDASISQFNSSYIPSASPTIFNSTSNGNITKSPLAANNDNTQTRINSDSNSDVFLYMVLVLTFMYSFIVILRMFRALRQRQRMVGMVNNMSANTGQIRQLLQSMGRSGRNAVDMNGMRSRLRLAMMSRDFTGDDFDLLRQLDDMDGHGHFGPGPGMEQGDINRLPLHTITEADLKPSDSAETRPGGNKSCTVCLAPYEVGDSVRTLTCLHQFHKDCIDPWLHTHSTCPICKFAAVVD